MRFVLRMTVRELRASWRRLVFFFVCVAIGVGAIVALRSVIQNVRGNLVRDVWVTNEAGQPVLVSQQLIAQGAAEAKVSDPNTRFTGWLQQTEADAQDDGAGLWGACGE